MRRSVLAGTLALALAGLVSLVGAGGAGERAISAPQLRVWEVGDLALTLEQIAGRAKYDVALWARLRTSETSALVGARFGRDHRPPSETYGVTWDQTGQFIEVSDASGDRLSLHNSGKGRTEGEVLFAFQQHVLHSADRLPGWLADGVLVSRDGFSAIAEEQIAHTGQATGDFSLDIYLWYWSVEDPDEGYAGACWMPGGSLQFCHGENTVTELHGRLVCSLDDPVCQAVAYATVTLPLSLNDLPWPEAMGAEPPQCPAEVLAEIGWNCDLTRIEVEADTDAEMAQADTG